MNFGINLNIGGIGMSAKNWVLEGDYKHKSVTMKGKTAVLFAGITKQIPLDRTTIDQIEVMDEEHSQSMGSAVARGAVGSLLLGPFGAVAALTAKQKGVYVVAIQFKDGKKSLLELDDTRFKAIKVAMF
jgi:hypothetical protein